MEDKIVKKNKKDVRIGLEVEKQTVVNSPCILDKKGKYEGTMPFDICRDCPFYEDGKCVYDILKMNKSGYSAESRDAPAGSMPVTDYKWLFDCPYCETEGTVRYYSGLSTIDTVQSAMGNPRPVKCEECHAVFVAYDSKYDSQKNERIYTFVARS